MEHIFVEWDGFCQQVLKKHWPEAKIYGDIRQFTTYPKSKQNRGVLKPNTQRHPRTESEQGVDLLTGGFPCQPFSAAGLRRGTADDRHLWPEMLRVIRLTQPTWVIAENVRGLLTWNEGLVFEQVCADLEAEGYEVQPLVIPAVAVNAPHRRDRVWFVGHAKHAGLDGSEDGEGTGKRTDGDTARAQQPEQPARPGGLWQETVRSWERNWTEVAAELCSVDDGLPVTLDGFELSKSQHRKEQLKAYGNAIVPQVAMEIMRAMKETTHD
jgi:DNA (cytosine-5)-methyltransferase 1